MVGKNLTWGLRICLFAWTALGYAGESKLDADAALKRRDYDEAISSYTAAILSDPTNHVVLMSRGIAYDLKGDRVRAKSDYDAAIQIAPEYCFAYVNRGGLNEKIGEFKAAVSDFTTAIKLCTNDSVALHGRGNVFLKMGDIDLAIADFSDCIRIAPDFFEALVNRAAAYARKRDFKQALQDYETVIRMASSSFYGYAGAAEILATAPDAALRDGAKAVAHARRACELTDFNNPQVIVILADAYAETGDFKKAKHLMKEAIDGARSDQEKVEYKRHLELFERNEPFHAK